MIFIDSYKEYKKIRGETYRTKLRGIALDTLSVMSSTFENWNALQKKPRVQFLYIHHIFKDEEQAFDELLAKLSLCHTFISHSEAVSRVIEGRIDKPYISLSSDDGLKNNLNAAKILNRYNAKACFFICPAIISESDNYKITLFCKEKLHFPPVEFMNWSDIECLLKDGHEIGGHTMNHVNLAHIEEAEQWHEINECYEQIKRRCGYVSHFAFPYGRFRDFSTPAKEKVFQSGFISCTSAERGCHIAQGKEIINYKDVLFRRDNIVLSWPLDHIMFFLIQNAKKASFKNNEFRYK